MSIRLSVTTVVLVLALTTGSGQRTPLASDPGRDRVVLVFAPDEHDRRLSALAADRARLACELANRQVVIEVVAGAETDRQRSLREAYNVPLEAFVAVLIGKDGGEKRRESGAVDLAAMVRLIDTMPMRRAEKEDDLDCGGPVSSAPRESGS
jgi:hypothetical protein